jgi:hypothetical protein
MKNDWVDLPAETIDSKGAEAFVETCRQPISRSTLPKVRKMIVKDHALLSLLEVLGDDGVSPSRLTPLESWGRTICIIPQTPAALANPFSASG